MKIKRRLKGAWILFGMFCQYYMLKGFVPSTFWSEYEDFLKEEKS